MTDPKRPEDEEVDETEDPTTADESAMADPDETADDLDDEQVDGDELIDGLDEQDIADAGPKSAAAVAAAEAAPKPTSSKTGKATSTVQPVDELPYVDDRVSKIWVALIGLTFLGILLYGLFLGTGGFLNPPTPEPTEPPATPALSASPAPTGTPAATGTPDATGTPGTTATPGATGTPAATPSPATSPAPTAGTT